jgi:hypothetical protein
VSEVSPASGAIIDSLIAGFTALQPLDHPFRHWVMRDVFPANIADALAEAEFPRVELNCVSGKRELHNDQRQYLDPPTNAARPLCAATAEAFQSQAVARAVAAATGAPMNGVYARLEYAQDTDGFWLQPHTDLGVKHFTMLVYLGEGEAEWGTDLYDGEGRWAARAPFVHNSALIFVPGDDTWHGFEPRLINGVRRTLIINYVTNEWRAREQLAFPQAPISV